MKWILTIWAFYLLALSSLPCSDVSNECNDTNVSFTTAQAHEHSQDTDDQCSPFCYCNCCRVNVASFQFASLDFKPVRTPFDVKKIVIREFNFVSNYFGNIWQPPKLSA